MKRPFDRRSQGFNRMTPVWAAAFWLVVLAPTWVGWASEPVRVTVSPDVQVILDKDLPESVNQLKQLEAQSETVTQHVAPTLVHVVVEGRVRGSGVVVSPDGYVLTAGHVNGRADRNVTFVFTDGKRAKGKTLGVHSGIDAGLMKITDQGPWLYADMAPAKSVEIGDWCIGMGHPGGFDPKRPFVTRIGRVLRVGRTVMQTDATIVGGDSGGPLFDMAGRVVGIHSRINPSMTGNFHVPIDAYHQNWDRLIKGEVWGGRIGQRPDRGFLGVRGETTPEGVRLVEVIDKTAAQRAGLRVGDVVVKLDGQPLDGIEALVDVLSESKPDQEIKLDVLREGEVITLTAKLGPAP